MSVRAYDLPVGNNAGLYALTEEHEAIRAAVRDIAEREIAPFAADVDAELPISGRGAEGADDGGLPRHAHPRGLRR